MVLAEAGILGSVEVGVDRALVVHLQNKWRQSNGLVSIVKELGRCMDVYPRLEREDGSRIYWVDFPDAFKPQPM